MLGCMSFTMLVAVLIATFVANLAINGLWAWLAARLFWARKCSYWRAFLAALATTGLLFAFSSLCFLIHPALILALPLAAILAVWLIHRIISLSLGRAAGIWIVTLALCAAVNIVLGVALRVFWLQAFVASSKSMEPTLKPGDRFMVDRTLSPRRWDIVVIQSAQPAGQVWPVRVIGLPGETISLRGHSLSINGLDSPIPVELERISFDAPLQGYPDRGGSDGPFTLGPGEFFVIGDNTSRAMDSRHWMQSYGTGVHLGAVPERAIFGVARAIYWPASDRRVFR